MSEGKNPSQQELSSVPQETASASARFASRRRLIKLGGVAAPVALTLTSRPVMAWHCNTTSAWGSAQINPNQSTTARNSSNELADETWSIDNWKNNTSRAGLGLPWTQLGLAVGISFQTTNSSSSTYYKKYTAAQLFSAYGLPSGISGTDLVWDKIANGTQWQKYMIVARLNAILIKNVKTCLSNSTQADQLKLMATGTYSPTNLGGVVWNQAQIIQYLQDNWIVRDWG